MGITTAFLRDNPDGHTEFLLDRAKLGSRVAWGEFYRRYHTMLLVQVRSRIPGFARRRFDAEDLLQEAFTKALQNIQTFSYEREGCFRRYLSQLVVNEFRNQLEAHKRENYRRVDESALPQVPDQAPENENLTEERMTMLEKMGELEEEERDLISMHYFESLPFNRIAEVQGCSPDTARRLCASSLSRLLRLMRA